MFSVAVTVDSLSLKRIQRVFWWHVDITIVDISQHGVKGLLTWHHLPNGDINLTILRHKGAEHCLKVTAEPQYKCCLHRHNIHKRRWTASRPWTSCQDGFMSRTWVSVQQEDDVTKFQAASFQVGLHVLDQGGADVHRLVWVQSGRGLLLSPDYFHYQRGRQMFKLFGHDHLVEVWLLHHKIKAMFLEEEGS